MHHSGNPSSHFTTIATPSNDVDCFHSCLEHLPRASPWSLVNEEKQKRITSSMHIVLVNLSSKNAFCLTNCGGRWGAGTTPGSICSVIRSPRCNEGATLNTCDPGIEVLGHCQSDTIDKTWRYCNVAGGPTGTAHVTLNRTLGQKADGWYPLQNPTV